MIKNLKNTVVDVEEYLISPEQFTGNTQLLKFSIHLNASTVRLIMLPLIRTESSLRVIVLCH
jgi:hypothetical protein